VSIEYSPVETLSQLKLRLEKLKGYPHRQQRLRQRLRVGNNLLGDEMLISDCVQNKASLLLEIDTSAAQNSADATSPNIRQKFKDIKADVDSAAPTGIFVERQEENLRLDQDIAGVTATTRSIVFTGYFVGANLRDMLPKEFSNSSTN
jgi:hypothetical protein